RTGLSLSPEAGLRRGGGGRLAREGLPAGHRPACFGGGYLPGRGVGVTFSQANAKRGDSSCIETLSPTDPDKTKGGCTGCGLKGMSTAVEDAYVGVRFREETNLTLCSTGGRIYARGDQVVVELESGPTFGHVEQSPMPVFKPCQKSSARPILRAADESDLAA